MHFDLCFEWMKLIVNTNSLVAQMDDHNGKEHTLINVILWYDALSSGLINIQPFFHQNVHF